MDAFDAELAGHMKECHAEAAERRGWFGKGGGDAAKRKARERKAKRAAQQAQKRTDSDYIDEAARASEQRSTTPRQRSRRKQPAGRDRRPGMPSNSEKERDRLWRVLRQRQRKR